MSLTVINPVGSGGLTYPDGVTNVNNLSGKQGEQLGADLHGKWFNANVRRGVFTFTTENVSFPLIPIVLIDERFTSKMAFQSMIDNGMSKKQRSNKGLIDEISATIILQSYMQTL